MILIEENKMIRLTAHKDMHSLHCILGLHLQSYGLKNHDLSYQKYTSQCTGLNILRFINIFVFKQNFAIYTKNLPFQQVLTFSDINTPLQDKGLSQSSAPLFDFNVLSFALTNALISSLHLLNFLP